MPSATNLQSLPQDILVMLPEYIHNIEDYTNLSSTCRTLRNAMATATPNTILRLAAAQSKIFFRPDPLFLLVATARELGIWARKSDANEQAFASKCKGSNEGLLELALEHCGLTPQRIRELHLARFTIINPVVDIIDKCVGNQWYAIEDFWSGGVSDACTIPAEPAETFFHLAIYGELFASELEALLMNQDAQASATRMLKVSTRLAFVKHCIPNLAFTGIGNSNANGFALQHTVRSSRWRPYWKEMRALAGVADFQEGFEYGKFSLLEEREEEKGPNEWRQDLWESVMLCQGLEGLGMMLPRSRDAWVDKVRMWREQVSRLPDEPPALVMDESRVTLRYPYIVGDLECA